MAGVISLSEVHLFPIMLIFGWICNVLAIAVLQTKAYRGFIMTVLAIADIGNVNNHEVIIIQFKYMTCIWFILVNIIRYQ
jgi:hypothetical protein